MNRHRLERPHSHRRICRYMNHHLLEPALLHRRHIRRYMNHHLLEPALLHRRRRHCMNSRLFVRPHLDRRRSRCMNHHLSSRTNRDRRRAVMNSLLPAIDRLSPYMNHHLSSRTNRDRRRRRCMNSRLLGRSHLRKDHCRGCLAGNWFPGGRVGRRLWCRPVRSKPSP